MRKSLYLSIIMILSLLAGAQSQDQQTQQDQKRPPSTPEERKRFVALVHKLEKAPLDQNLNSEVTWALQFLQDIPDVNVSICLAPLGHLAIEDYRYVTRISGQFVLGMGAYLMEHPQKAADVNATYIAGVESALKAYKSILRSKPDAKSHTLDELVSKEEDGQLSDFVREASKACEDTSRT